MKRIVCLMMCAAMLLSFSACKKDKDNNEKADSTPTQVKPATVTEQEPETAPAPTELSDTEELKNFINAIDKTPAVEEQVVYENDHLTVTLNSLIYHPVNGPELHFTIDNKYNKEIAVQSDYIVVNDCMISPEQELKVPAGMEVSVPAGKSAQAVMTIPYFELAISNISTLRKIEFNLDLSDVPTYRSFETTDMITVTTTAPQDVETAFNDEGQTAYDKNGVKIVIKGMNEDHTYSDNEKLIVSIQNTTAGTIAVKPKEFYVNDYEITPISEHRILPGKQATGVFSISKLDLTGNGIRSIDSVDVSFVISSLDPPKCIDTTDKIDVDLTISQTITPSTPDAATK